MKPRDYDPDFSYLVTNRRRAARLALAGYAFIVLMIACVAGTLVAGIWHAIRFL